MPPLRVLGLWFEIQVSDKTVVYFCIVRDDASPIMSIVRVKMHEFKTAVAPNFLITEGLGPCIGVAVIYNTRGFLLHSPDVIMESDEVENFLNLLDRRIPRTSRAAIVPVVAGGSLEEYSGEPSDEEIRESTRDCRREILRLLHGAGFGRPKIRWGKPNQCSALILDLIDGVIRLSTFDLRNVLLLSEDFPATVRPDKSGRKECRHRR